MCKVNAFAICICYTWCNCMCLYMRTYEIDNSAKVESIYCHGNVSLQYLSFFCAQRGISKFVSVSWLQSGLMLIRTTTTSLWHRCHIATTITTVTSILIIFVISLLMNVSSVPQVGSLTLTKPNSSRTLQPQS